MYVSEQMIALASRMEDALVDGQGVEFTNADKLMALRNAEMKILTLLDNKYLTELEEVELSLSLTSGAFALSGLTNIAINGAKGIFRVKVGTYWASPLDIEDAKFQENSLYAAGKRDPRYFVFGNTLYIYPSSSTVIDAYYLRKPSPLLGLLTYGDTGGDASNLYGDSAQDLSTTNDHYNGAVIRVFQPAGSYAAFESHHIVTDYVGSTRKFTVTPSLTGGSTFAAGTFAFITDPFTTTALSGVKSDLNEGQHDIMTTLAEAELWGNSKDFDRQGAALKSAYDTIAVLNEKARKG